MIVGWLIGTRPSSAGAEVAPTTVWPGIRAPSARNACSPCRAMATLNIKASILAFFMGSSFAKFTGEASRPPGRVLPDYECGESTRISSRKPEQVDSGIHVAYRSEAPYGQRDPWDSRFTVANLPRQRVPDSSKEFSGGSARCRSTSSPTMKALEYDRLWLNRGG